MKNQLRYGCLAIFCLVLFLSANVQAQDNYKETGNAGLQQGQVPHYLIQPEQATGHDTKQKLFSRHAMVGAANPLASKAGLTILKQGGSAADAAIAMQMVLNLVEPQSSGIGGGGFIMSYDAAHSKVQAWDGRETAPARAQPGRFKNGKEVLNYRQAVNNGRAVGTPGLLKALALLHVQQGKLAWKDLFLPAIELAESGFPVSSRLHGLLESNKDLPQNSAAAAYFYNKQGQPHSIGYKLKNPEFAKTLKRIASEGVQAFYYGSIAQNIVDAVAAHEQPGDLSLQDLADYRALERTPLCVPYRVFEICGMPPPSAGTVAVAQILSLLQYTPVNQYAPDSLQAVHYFSEAGRLAFADRDYYIADPDFSVIPLQGLLNKNYLKKRAGQIQSGRSLRQAQPGQPAGASPYAIKGINLEQPSTTHIVAADEDGNVISMTTSIEAAFGSKIFVNGFLLNNELTDFSWTDRDETGQLLANRVEPGKRPRSSMAPLIVLRQGKPFMAIGSPGGSAIINYVAKTVLAVLDWGLDIQQAIDLPHYGSRNQATELESGTPITRHRLALQAMGHPVTEMDFTSGLQGLVFTDQGIEGAADPRREGLMMGY